MRRHAIIAAFCIAAAPAFADELDALQGATVELNAFRGIVYYTEAADGYRVVTTIAEGEAGLPVRFEATLNEGESVTISVPGELGESSKAVEISRTGGILRLTSVEPVTEIVQAGE